jgi:Met-zincin
MKGNMQTIIRGLVFSGITLLAAACGDNSDAVGPVGEDVLTHDDLLVAIPRKVDAQEAQSRQDQLARIAPQLAPQGSGDFYLAIRKSALNERWFWSVYLKELQPFGPSPGTLGTKVVRFRVQNDTLYVFDADDRRATSDVFNPDLIIDAFPLVDSNHFNSLPGSGGYLLIDPAAGRNRFSAVADWFGSGSGGVKLETELSYLQNFKSANDGGSFEQIITAYSDQPIGFPGDVENNEYRLAATLGINLRKYKETPGFQQVLAPAEDHYFLTDPILVPNTGIAKQLAVHWGFKPGMQPVKWVISPLINQLAQDPSLGGADLYGSMKRGIESWNDVFGYEVFKVSLATPNDSFADDHVNYVIIDPDVSLGFAYADWRQNPNTGEIRGASVYFSSVFFSPFPDDATAVVNGIRKPTSKQAKAPSLVWQDQHKEAPCVIYRPETNQLTGAQKLEKYIQHVITHEVGHTLGLRHNFKGSLLAPTSSVMEYNDVDAILAQPGPGPYDADALAYLYGTSTNLPTQPFCTDDATLYDPNCVRFDPGTPTPLDDYQIPFYQLVTSLLLDGSIPAELTDLYLNFYGTELVGYARNGDSAESSAAWAALLDGVRNPTTPVNAAAVDAIAAWLYREVYIAPRGAIRDPIWNPAVQAAAANDAKAFLINTDQTKSYSTRRLLVDALKKAQNTDSFLALESAKAALTAQLPSLSATDQALTRDLIARITAALSPYFD